ncbi:MAG: hypothetical protein QNJ46_18815 [Leptolyngbyaceae cyanobacterium MO_188.B28]|nr:hypothetical protein [Leptolyngbyaceae cyanobacterium MO_188.B28]
MGISGKYIFLFLDGVGLGDRTPNNPLAQGACTPFLRELLGSPLLAGCEVYRPHLLLKPIDATLGVPGLPQSATGQTALYTGRNAPQFRGCHQTGFANGSLRILIEESGLFKQVLALDGTATHANLYSPAYFDAIAQRRLRYSVGTLLTLTANLPFRMQAEYARREAIYWDITGELVHHRGIDAPPITPQEAGRRLAALGSRYTVTLFECYLPDFAGHNQDMNHAVKILQRIDTFLESVVSHLSVDVTLILSSDHGNVEDLSSKRHTLNPAPLLAVGPHAGFFQSVEDITGITPKIVELINDQ